MKNALKISIYLLSIFLVLSGVGLGMGNFVTMADPDLGLTLTPLPAIPGISPFVFFDIQPNGIYDAADPVYLTANSIQARMNFLPKPRMAGTKVVYPNSDFFASLTFAPATNFNPTIAFVPKFGNPTTYVQGDPIYLVMDPTNNRISTNDIRLTPLAPVLAAGTKVNDGNSDWGDAWLSAPNTWSLQYADNTPDGVYDVGDHVFLHIGVGATVAPGDLHLSP